MICLGIDIGGTKLALSLGEVTGDDCRVLDKKAFPTPQGPDAALEAEAREQLRAARRRDHVRQIDDLVRI